MGLVGLRAAWKNDGKQGTSWNCLEDEFHGPETHPWRVFGMSTGPKGSRWTILYLLYDFSRTPNLSEPVFHLWVLSGRPKEIHLRLHCLPRRKTLTKRSTLTIWILAKYWIRNTRRMGHHSQQSYSKTFHWVFYIFQKLRTDGFINCGLVVVSNCHLERANIFVLSHEEKEPSRFIFSLGYIAVLILSH